MDRTLDIPTGQEAQRVASIDRDRPVEWLNPFPFVRGMVSDLKRRDRLAEEQRKGAEICVSLNPSRQASVLL